MLKKFQSHKVVEAAQILEVGQPNDAGDRILAIDGGGIPVRAAYVEKHAPVAGGYYVKYADGYESFSPAEAFESGYTPVDGPTLVEELHETLKGALDTITTRDMRIKELEEQVETLTSRWDDAEWEGDASDESPSARGPQLQKFLERHNGEKLTVVAHKGTTALRLATVAQDDAIEGTVHGNVFTPTS